MLRKLSKHIDNLKKKYFFSTIKEKLFVLFVYFLFIKYLSQSLFIKSTNIFIDFYYIYSDINKCF